MDLTNNKPDNGFDNGLVPSRWPAIVWTNDDLFTNTYLSH